jgi:hypothetical protein
MRREDQSIMLRPLRLLIVVIALVSLALPAASLAGPGVKAGATRGVVQSVDASEIVLRALDGSVVTFTVMPRTPVRLNGVRATITDVRPGFVARVTYDRQSRAMLIEAFGAAAAPVVERGIVTAVTRSSITLRTVAGASVTVAVDAGTRFRFHGAPARRQLARPGATVAVTHLTDGPATVVNVLKRAGA